MENYVLNPYVKNAIKISIYWKVLRYCEFWFETKIFGVEVSRLAKCKVVAVTNHFVNQGNLGVSYKKIGRMWITNRADTSIICVDYFNHATQ
ncbi:hypothetical protein BpHYR1_050329 [Brachionus plicatilis]|uniref:Uncharacterized protein n=1 Tax=Brachionus plicatilis TaxID=10195 RepID=A0A3M7SCS6_BRAPC|nr:hypothetical protein BpHYR1_050329 [Brachionus plicatilis]